MGAAWVLPEADETLDYRLLLNWCAGLPDPSSALPVGWPCINLNGCTAFAREQCKRAASKISNASVKTNGVGLWNQTT